ncbi:DNA circularization protein [Pseudomonas chlororaphis]|uniref:DNA circularization protein n=1 Tax=Pseudomonas chlororaphis TaxID=587753 RepID=UPI002365AD08|nr:DNA circularization N-terminal domain-containing protein [Pseudomonas chlororaphis]WDH24111.1 DNA circularization N-terminal domain-containing protein [Pseudomonas chlororaphis]
MTATWRDQLLPASFRGVSFLIPLTSVPVGMKGQLHEFPQRDMPFFEQLGKQAQVHKMTAWIIGDDCFERRDKLIEALETPGGGELVHPWLGRLQVKAGECDMSHDLTAGGMVVFDLTFYPDMPLKMPGAKVNTQAQVVNSSESLLTSSLNRYKTAMATVNKARLGLQQMRNSLSGVFSVIQQQFAPFANVFTDATGFAQSLMNSPGSLSSLFSGYFSSFSGFNFFSSSTGGGESSGGRESASSLASGLGYRGAVAEAAQQTEAVSSINVVSSGGGVDTAAASQATANLVQDAVLVQIGLIVSEMPVATQPELIESTPSVEQQAILPVVRPEVPVADDVIELRDNLNEAVFEASLKAGPEHYLVLNSFRQTVVKHLTAVAASGVRLVDITPPETLSALVLAYRRFGDATRAPEVVQRNRIRHPGFVPPVPIKLAQR